MRKEKGITSIILLVGLVLMGLFVGGAYFITMHGSAGLSKPAGGATEEKTKILRDGTYGFEFQYPAGWYLVSTVDGGGPYDQVNSISSSSYTLKLTQDNKIIPSGGFGATVYRTSSTLEQAFKDDMGVGDYALSPTSSVVIDGAVGFRVAYMHIVALRGDVGASEKRVAVYLRHGGLTYGIVFDSRGSSFDINALANEILNSFKFTDSPQDKH